MELSITIQLGDTLPLNKVVEVYGASHAQGFSNVDDYVSSLVAADLGKQPKTAKTSKVSKKGARAA